MTAPGLTAGTCLRKDFAFSEERSSAPGMLLAVSRVHETMPLFLVEGVKRRLGGTLRDCKGAVLGLSFKRNSDDLRDSLSSKLIRLLERELAIVARHDPHVPNLSDPLSAALDGANAVIIATNHSEFEKLLPELPRKALLVDPWNIPGPARVSAYADELVPAGAPASPPRGGGAGWAPPWFAA